MYCFDLRLNSSNITGSLNLYEELPVLNGIKNKASQNHAKTSDKEWKENLKEIHIQKNSRKLWEPDK